VPSIHIPPPQLQIQFSHDLEQMRSVCLQDALSRTIDEVDLAQLDKELTTYVPPGSLKNLAKHGLRGELVFPVPCLLRANPYLLGYYRLLLGFSRKEFYTAKSGVSRFKPMEEKGALSDKNKERLQDLCSSLIISAVALVDGIRIDRVSKELLDDLTLLTFGPQLRGSANVNRGICGIARVFHIIHGIVENAVVSSSTDKIKIENAAGRNVLIEFAPDPDIVIREELSTNKYRKIIAIEVKAGTDPSNIHNRIGEAEKSHQKAKRDGYKERWTVVNVDRMDMDKAKQESPSTDRFYLLSDLEGGRGAEFRDFEESIIALIGI